MRTKPFLALLFCTVLLCMLAACEQSNPIVHEHQYITIAAVAPSCSSPGYTEGTKCLSCGYIVDRPQTIPPSTHIYEDAWTIDREPTEHREGEKSLRCIDCGKRSAVSPIARLAPSTQGLDFELNETKDAYICVGIGTAKLENELRIPAEYNGLPVTEIGEYAFENNRRLTSLYVPTSVTVIGRAAFLGCSSLSSIDLPDTLEYIASHSFLNTGYYGNRASWEDGALYIGRHLISVNSTTAVNSYTIRHGTRTVAGTAFYNCSKMTSVTIPQGVVSLGNSAFYGCSSLQSIDFPDSLRIIGNGALAYCTSLTEFCLPASISSILSNPFPGSTSLTSLTVDVNNPYFYSVDNCLIERSTGTLIAGCTTSIIPDDGSIKRIGNAAFYEFPIRSISIPEGITAIGSAAFYQCAELQEISLPSTLTDIGDQAFQGCQVLSQISLPQSLDTIGSDAFHGCEALTELTIPEGVEVLSVGAFAGCARLQSLSLPSTLTTISGDALANCTVLSSLYYAGTQQKWEQIVKEAGWNRGALQINIHYAQ